MEKITSSKSNEVAMSSKESTREGYYIRAFFARMAIAILRENKRNGSDAIEKFITNNATSLMQSLHDEIDTVGESVDEGVVTNLRMLADTVAKLEMSPVVEGLPNTTVFKRILSSRLAQVVNDSVIVPAGSEQKIEDLHLNEMMEHMDRFRLIFFDVNGLKAANDIGGHAAGDMVLQNFGLVAQEVATAMDQKSFHVFHKSGDEFVVFCEDCSQGEIDDFIERVQNKYGTYNLIKDILDTRNPDTRIRLARVIASTDEAIIFDKDNIDAIIDSAPKVPLSVAAGTATIAKMMRQAAHRLIYDHVSVNEAIAFQSSDLLPTTVEHVEQKSFQDVIEKIAERLINMADEGMQSAKEEGKHVAAEKNPQVAAILSFGRS